MLFTRYKYHHCLTFLFENSHITVNMMTPEQSRLLNLTIQSHLKVFVGYFVLVFQ